jgi:glutathione S-transferase
LVAKLDVIAASHPCACVKAALAIKGLEYRRVELPDVVHRPLQRLRYGRPTVPRLTLADGEKVIGSVAILRRLEQVVAERPLYPVDPEGRRRVEAAEAWAEAVLQDAARRIEVALFRRRPSADVSYLQASTLPIPRWLIRANAPVGARLYAKLVGADDEAARADLHALAGHLDQVDSLIAAGTIGAEAPNAADLQIGASASEADLEIAQLGQHDDELTSQEDLRRSGEHGLQTRELEPHVAGDQRAQPRNEIVVLLADESHPRVVLAQDDHRVVLDMKRLRAHRQLLEQLRPVDQDLLETVELREVAVGHVLVQHHGTCSGPLSV